MHLSSLGPQERVHWGPAGIPLMAWESGWGWEGPGMGWLSLRMSDSDSVPLVLLLLPLSSTAGLGKLCDFFWEHHPVHTGWNFRPVFNAKENWSGFPGGEWLRCCASKAGRVGLIPGRGTKIPYAAQHSQPLSQTNKQTGRQSRKVLFAKKNYSWPLNSMGD